MIWILRTPRSSVSRHASTLGIMPDAIVPLLMSSRAVDSCNEWIREFGQGLQNRDVMFERFEALSDFSRSKQGYKKWSKKAENLTTAILRNTDAIAAYWSFMGSYFDQGGTLENPDTDKIAGAEVDTDMLQNISNPRFTSELFKQHRSDHHPSSLACRRSESSRRLSPWCNRWVGPDRAGERSR